jgi:hypothetical protein
MTLEELASRLKELDEARRVLEAEVTELKRSEERAERLEQDREAVLDNLASLVPEALDHLSGEERNRLYRMLRLEITPTPEGYETTGVFRTSEPTPAALTAFQIPQKRFFPPTANRGRCFSLCVERW